MSCTGTGINKPLTMYKTDDVNWHIIILSKFCSDVNEALQVDTDQTVNKVASAMQPDDQSNLKFATSVWTVYKCDHACWTGALTELPDIAEELDICITPSIIEGE